MGWVDISKGDEESPDYRPRIAALACGRKGEDSIFAAIPPLEALQYLVSLAASERGKKGSIEKQCSEIIRRAYFNAPIIRPTSAQLPPDLAQEGTCFKLHMSLYGKRSAAQSWEEEYGQKCVEWVVYARSQLTMPILAYRKGYSSFRTW